MYVYVNSFLLGFCTAVGGAAILILALAIQAGRKKR